MKSRCLELGHHARYTPVDSESKRLHEENGLKLRILAGVKRVCPECTVEFGRWDGELSVRIFWIPGNDYPSRSAVRTAAYRAGRGHVIGVHAYSVEETQRYYPNTRRE